MDEKLKIFDFENSVIFTNELSEEISPATLPNHNNPPMVQTQPQIYNDPPAVQASPYMYADYEKVSTHMQLAQIDVIKNQEMNEQRLEYERQKNEMKIYNQERMKMFSYEISQDTLGQIRYASMGVDDKEKICSKVLLNVFGYKAVLLKSLFPEAHIVLHISWEGCKEAVCLENGCEGIPANKFLKRLKAKGVVLRCSKRQENAVADVLLSYSLNIAEEVEIPGCLGWNMMEKGRWHFAYKNETTMKEVLKYA